MAEFCLDCLNRLGGTDDPPEKYYISKDLDLCEECGELKKVVVTERTHYLFRSLIMDLYRLIKKKKGSGA